MDRSAESSSSAAVQHRIIAEEEGKKLWSCYVCKCDGYIDVGKTTCSKCIRIHITRQIIIVYFRT